jgi:hypothetical protein
MVLLVGVNGDSMLFQAGKGGERSGTVVTVVVLFGLSSNGLAGWGGDRCNSDIGSCDGSDNSSDRCWSRRSRGNPACSMNERVSKMIS